MRRLCSALAGSSLVVLFALAITSLASPPAVAGTASGSIGCGGGNGASTPCNGQNLGSVTLSGGLASGSVDVAITSVSGLPSSVSGLQVFTPGSDQFDFSFSSVGFSFSNGGTFSFTDLTEMGLLSVSGVAEYGMTPSPTTLSMVLDATSYTFQGNTGTLSAMGNATLNLEGDPTVSSMTGTVGLPNVGGSGATPEPGTLLLLGSGLTALGFLGRKFAQA